jgi:hypothetical protein
MDKPIARTENEVKIFLASQNLQKFKAAKMPTAPAPVEKSVVKSEGEFLKKRGKSRGKPRQTQKHENPRG